MLFAAAFLICFFLWVGYPVKRAAGTDTDREFKGKDPAGIAIKDWPFDWGLLEGPLECDWEGDRWFRRDETAGKCEGHLRVIMQYPEFNATDIRRTEYTNSLLCTLANPSVKSVHLMLEKGNRDNFLPSLRRSVAELSAYGDAKTARRAQDLARDECRKMDVVALGHRIKYKDLLTFINAHPEWEGEPILATNADISVSSGFGDLSLLKRLVTNGKTMAISRYESSTCGMLGSYYDGHKFECSCGTTDDVCIDSYLLTYPVSRELESLGFEDGVDFYFGGLWNSENIFIKRMKQFGSQLYNPCHFLRLQHHHCSQSRPNQKKGKNGNEIHLYDVIETPDEIDDKVPYITKEGRVIQTYWPLISLLIFGGIISLIVAFVVLRWYPMSRKGISCAMRCIWPMQLRLRARTKK